MASGRGERAPDIIAQVHEYVVRIATALKEAVPDRLQWALTVVNVTYADPDRDVDGLGNTSL